MPRFVSLLRQTGGLAATACVLFLSACAQTPPYGSPERIGAMPPTVKESSGVALSLRDTNLLWTHDDSGGQPVVHALTKAGVPRGDLRIEGIRNRDWEDVSTFALDGRTWLLIADTGDNNSRREDCAIYIVAEPDPATLVAGGETLAQVAWKIPVRYIDGPRDCEAVAVDPREGTIYLLAKRTSPHGLYTLPLRIPADGIVPAAQPILQVPNNVFPQPTGGQRLLPIPSGHFRAQPTGMDFAIDGSAAVVVTYGEVIVFKRAKGETWKTAFEHAPLVLEPHGLTQAEGVAFGPDSKTIYVTSEGAGSPILRYKPVK